MNRTLLLTSLLAAFAVAGAATAATPIQQTREIGAKGRVQVENVRGSITVTAWDQPRVEISGSLGEGSKLLVGGGADDVSVRIESGDESGWSWWNGNRGPREDTVLELKVPRAASLDLGSVSADVRVSGTRGADSVEVDSVSGDVEVDAEAARIELESVSGDATLKGRSPSVSLESVSGDIEAVGVSGRVTGETVSGTLRIDAGAVTGVKLASVSGDVELNLGDVGSATIDIESMSGEIDVRVPANASARFEAETFSGSIRSDFGTVEEGDGPGSSLDATVGSGAADVSLESFSGDVTIRRR